MLARGNPLCGCRARPSLRRASPPPPLGWGRARLRCAGAVASAPPASRGPACGGPPARAPGAAERPPRVPLGGARRICRGFGRRSSTPGGLNPRALGGLSPAFFRSARAGPRRGAALSAGPLIGCCRAGGLSPALALSRRFTRRRFALAAALQQLLTMRPAIALAYPRRACQQAHRSW